MKRLHVRTLLNLSTDELWGCLAGRFTLVFDDGSERLVTRKATLVSSRFWEFFRVYSNAPCTPDHHLSTHLNGNSLTNGVYKQLLKAVFWTVASSYQLETDAARQPLRELAYEVIAAWYGDLCERTLSYVTTIDIVDLVEVLRHPKIRPILDKRAPTPQAVDTVMTELRERLTKDPELRNNRLVRTVWTGTLQLHQVLQIVGERGYLTDVDGVRLPLPVLSNYTEGMSSYYDLLAESRLGEKSILLSEKPLRDTQSRKRRLELLVSVVETLYDTDCGSQDYMYWRVNPAHTVRGRVVQDSDLSSLVGKYYLDPDTNALKAVTRNDTHLIGQPLKLRAVHLCQHPDPHGVCAVCFGALAKNLPDGINLGYRAVVELMMRAGQNILSIKHVEGSTVAPTIEFGDFILKFFEVKKDGITLCLKKEYRNKDILFSFPKEAAEGLTDVYLVASTDQLDPTSITRLPYADLTVPRSGGGSDIYPLGISSGYNPAYLTREFLAYIKMVGWTSDLKGNFVINLKGWNPALPLLRYPEVEYSYSQHAIEFVRIIEAKIRDMADREKPGMPEATLRELFNRVNRKLKVPLSVLEVIIYSLMVRNARKLDYGLARNSPNPGLGVAKRIMSHRSLGPAYGLGDQVALMTMPTSFRRLNRPDSVMDVFMLPREVVAAYKSKGKR